MLDQNAKKFKIKKLDTKSSNYIIVKNNYNL